MMSISNDEARDPLDARIIDAAADCVIAFGVDRVTLAEIARRAGVSRPTVYRRWPDTQAILAALLTARITNSLNEVAVAGTDREAIVERMVGMAERLRDDEVIMSVLSSAPALAMVYISQRMGTSQQILLEVLAGALATAQTDGSVRPGDPRQLAAMCLLIVQSAIQSAQMVAPVLDVAALDIELAHSLNGYLKP
ncbi:MULTISPECIES: TetR/AcrR family transcriptional regulator [Mycolicibacterium]|uniref:TetR family transcriptional regulator n=1 Tax=Mycolicibacterium phocaicum TaxID=319706 RepID=A0A7I7ZNA8_9MYCO|nr:MULTISPECIES: TetR/AcrR family transcriptional regulator [Mycolicibacterium]RUP34089.1 MAG: TetR/AcrR family transcriptional regulator [Mycolicibacterium sp.]TLH71547.1 TetR family transcriptional regulator [Mycolicibacterium phocaicum]BBZ54887.1 TetR family transcriptional regulator [Mycolicibacterium phocaicum]